MTEPTFDDDHSIRREMSARRASRLAVYQRPVPRDVQRALAIEDAIEATRRACFATIDAGPGLSEIYVLLRMAVARLEALE